MAKGLYVTQEVYDQLANEYGGDGSLIHWLTFGLQSNVVPIEETKERGWHIKTVDFLKTKDKKEKLFESIK